VNLERPGESTLGIVGQGTVGSASRPDGPFADEGDMGEIVLEGPGDKSRPSPWLGAQIPVSSLPHEWRRFYPGAAFKDH
jgi:hypothetical protein